MFSIGKELKAELAEHHRIQVQSRDATVHTDRFCRQPCDEPVPHATSRTRSPGNLDDTRASRPENGRHQLALVDLSRVARDLPSFALRHAVAAATLRRAAGSPARTLLEATRRPRFVAFGLWEKAAVRCGQ